MRHEKFIFVESMTNSTLWPLPSSFTGLIVSTSALGSWDRDKPRSLSAWAYRRERSWFPPRALACDTARNAHSDALP